MDVFVQLGDTTIAIARTDQDGGFTAQLYMPVTSEGDQTLTAVDESGNVASTSYFTEFGIGNMQDQNDDLARQLEEIRKLLTPGGAGRDGRSPAPSTLP